MNERWDRHFLKLAYAHAKMSKDPNTQCGAVIVGPDRGPKCFGFNGLPRKVEDTCERLDDREIKHKLVVHAEINAIDFAAKNGIAIDGCTMYVVSITQGIVSSVPCIRCAVQLIQAGITEIVGYESDYAPHWTDPLTTEIFKEAGISYRLIKQEDDTL
jgi:dCMP deaminase